jgi:hypothetical protein
MPNPYHDADGKFASRDELNNNVNSALQRGDMQTYIRERENLDNIEREIAAKKQEDPYYGEPEVEDNSHKVKAHVPRTWKDVQKSWETNEDTWKRIDESFSSLDKRRETLLSHPIDLENIQHYNPAHDESRHISQPKIDAYELKGTRKGAEYLEENAGFHRAFRRVATLKAGSVNIKVPQSNLFAVQAEASRAHQQKLDATEEQLRVAPNLKDATHEAITQTSNDRKESWSKHRKAQFELAYTLSQAAKHPEGKDRSQQAISLLEDVQRHHDETVYAAVRMRKLAAFLGNARL